MNRWLLRAHPVMLLLCVIAVAIGCSGLSQHNNPSLPNEDGSRKSSTWHKGSLLSNDFGGVDGGACMVHGRPAFCYMEESSGDLRFVRAADADGTTWSANPVTVDSGGTNFTGVYTSMVPIAGNPAIAYQRDDDLYYTRANDIYGLSWATPVLLDSIGDTGVYCKMLVVSGNPAVAYYREGSGLYYVRAEDEEGDSWDDPVLIEYAGPYFSNLVMVDGRPAIAYTDGTDLYYLRADDSTGSSWSTDTDAELIDDSAYDLHGAPSPGGS